MTNFKSQNKSQISINQVPNMFESLKIRIWILFVICELVLGIFSIKELNWIKIYHTTFETYL